jgi:transposase
MRGSDWTKVLGWLGYRVYRHEIEETGKKLKLWVRRKRGHRKLVCSGCGRRVSELHDVYEREVRDLQKWIDQLRWQRLAPFQKLARMLLDHLEGILNYCRTKVPLGVIEAVNGNIKTLLRRGRGYKNLAYLLL